MSVFDSFASGAAQWAICDTLYFNSTTHSFARGDLEIDDSRIKRILPPKASRRANMLPGDQIVCLPGLINPDTALDQENWIARSQELALNGVTTAGAFCRGLPDFEVIANNEGVRRLLYVELGEDHAGNESAGIDQYALDSFERGINETAFGRCELFPAVVPREIWSAATLLAAASASERLGRRLCVRLCTTKCDAQNYAETRFFTEVGLLSYLSILGRATIFNLSQLSRRDVVMLNDSAANLVWSLETIGSLLIEHNCVPFSMNDRAIRFSMNRDALADPGKYASVMITSIAFSRRSDCVVETCNTLVDSLTRSAALALGIEDIGAIAADMKADLCLFDRPADLCESRDSRYFIKLLDSERPRHVFIDGSPVIVDGTFVRELAAV
jgi:hypothetical protein